MGRVKAEREGWRGEGGRKQRGARCGERRDSERNGRIFHTPRSHIIFFFFFSYFKLEVSSFQLYMCEVYVCVDGCRYGGWVCWR